MKVALFIPCYVRAVDPDVIEACWKLLRHLGVDVEIPPGQTCCGQPMGNAGYEEDTKALKARFETLFQQYDVIVGPSSSCVAYIREHYGDLFRGRIFEICEYIHDVLKPESLPGRFPHKVSLHNSCHGTRLAALAAPSELNIPYFNKLKDLLGLIDGVEVVEPERRDECCGFADREKTHGPFPRLFATFLCRTDSAEFVRKTVETAASFIYNESKDYI